jgi:hypothetical protein
MGAGIILTAGGLFSLHEKTNTNRDKLRSHFIILKYNKLLFED